MDSVFYLMYRSRLEDYIKVLKDDLLSVSWFHLDEPLVEKTLKNLIERDLPYLIGNEIFIDLILSYKSEDYRYKRSRDLEKLIILTYMKYVTFIRLKVQDFYTELPKIPKKKMREKLNITKIKRVRKIIEPIKISLDIRYAIIQRANRKCEKCGRSIFAGPIDVYQIKNKFGIELIAYCELCKEENEEVIITDHE